MLHSEPSHYLTGHPLDVVRAVLALRVSLGWRNNYPRNPMLDTEPCQIHLNWDRIRRDITPETLSL